ncbi:sensor histidine kinase N-terminal domain-containing protein [Kiloniella laminariae]|uniref:histidine kinase n=1 Tax=Kiloniella laminariae TaxID=454162 RepID=A0ABT4LGJ0_9PROT|nr:sensor histidine kinase [Kiloniella laminariae]MCZ4280226.1 sensor histidine kinase N-terminal domain-containing protein [Kiloniella laminariae]
MSWQRKSLRRRLLLWLMGALALISLLMLFDVHSSANKAANKAYDRVLLGSALAIAERVVIVGDELEVDVPYVALEMLTSAAQDRVFYQISGPGGSFITGYNDLPSVPHEEDLASEEPVFFDAEYRGDKIRVGAISRHLSSPRLSARFTVMVAETLEARNILIREMVTGALIRQLILILVAGVVLWIGIGWGLKPLLRLEAALNRRTPHDLRPIEHEVPREVRHLIEAINDLMYRLGASLGAMQRFTSNAAHQLRTPLAAIQTQAELAIDELDPKEQRKRLEHLSRSTRQTSRLVNQLLSLARAHQGKQNFLNDVIDLKQLSIEVTTNLVPQAVARDIDLGFECPDASFKIMGNRDLIIEALKNLIDNALRYCPPGAAVTVGLEAMDKQILLSVDDNGPGIPEEERTRVFERFYRTPGQDDEGCGLGLPIVKEIMEQHGGQVECRGRKKGQGASFLLFFSQA